MGADGLGAAAVGGFLLILLLCCIIIAVGCGAIVGLVLGRILPKAKWAVRAGAFGAPLGFFVVLVLNLNLTNRNRAFGFMDFLFLSLGGLLGAGFPVLVLAWWQGRKSVPAATGSDPD
jgi:hypothetical protein